jgi:hypothetical protein
MLHRSDDLRMPDAIAEGKAQCALVSIENCLEPAMSTLSFAI